MLNQEDMLRNPLSIQKTILDDFSIRLDDKEYEIVDANNPFMFMLETFARTVSQYTVSMDTKLNSLYPRRATTTKELYHHVSDYDYVGFFSSPASIRLSIMLHKEYIIENAIQVPGTNYKLIVIPKDTVFSIGRFKFSLYYPVHIRINSIVQNVTAVYDTTHSNPLHSLQKHGIDTSETTYGGISLIQLSFEVYQFDKTIIDEVVSPNLGFAKKYKYEDRFYAIRAFDTLNDTELAYSMSDVTYDPSNPTINLKVYPELNEIEISIPQIYFDDNILGSNIRFELYTTVGEIDSSINNVAIDEIEANFAIDTTTVDLEYTSILKYIPTFIISPIDSRIVGGSNNQNFQQMKDAIIYHSMSDVVPITSLQLDKYFESKGFLANKILDNLTDRRYLALKKLVSGVDDKYLGVVNGTLTLSATESTPNSSFIYQHNNTIVVLPTAIYKYRNKNDSFSQLSDDENHGLVNESPSVLVDILNDEIYTCNPYHLVIYKDDKYPIASTYDLLSCTVDNISFKEENIFLSAQLSLISTSIKHLGDGSNGYIVRLGIKKSDIFSDIPENDIKIYATVLTDTQTLIGSQCVWIEQFDGIDIYDITLSTDYVLDKDTIDITNFTNVAGSTQPRSINLSGILNITTYVKQSHFPGVSQNFSILSKLLSDKNGYLSVSYQTVDYKLGSRLDDVIDTNLLTTWSSEQYAEYPSDILLQYEHDVYEIDANGGLVNTGAPGEVILNKLHSAGDNVLDENTGDPIIQHHAGDTIVDVCNNPTSNTTRIVQFTCTVSMYDYRSYMVDDNFYSTLANDNLSYYSAVRDMRQNMLENTATFFKPITTIGDTIYKLNNAMNITSRLNLSLEFKVFVKQAVYITGKLLDMIRTKIDDIVSIKVSDGITSLVSIATTINSELSDHIESIDIISVNEFTNIQTLVNTVDGKSPMINNIITLSDDGIYRLESDINVNFEQLDT